MAELYCFGRFTLNPDRRQLYADGVPMAVGNTAINILLVLVEHAGALVDKDALMSRVWGRTAIGDNRLHVHIHELRKAIGDSAIVTKSGSGYRFVAPVHRMRMRAPDISMRPSERKKGNLALLADRDGLDEPQALIGRTSELSSASQLLSENRLVTLTGPGGVGKTSLALSVANANASEFSDGVWLAELASLNDATLVPSAIATVLGIKIGQSATPIDTLARQLLSKSLLIILDNCEHVVSGAAKLAEALCRAAPYIKILATSREPLSCVGEHIFEVFPLTFPLDSTTPAEIVRQMPAVRLFLERVRSADSRFSIDDEGIYVAARICRRVDGLPLAIEMVSSWVGVLGLEILEAKLDGSLKAWLRARSTAPLRHSTMRATLEWSYNLLLPAEQTILRRLGVFQGSFTMLAAEAVASEDDVAPDHVFEHIASLVRKSIVNIATGSQPRSYRLLETTRAFALEKLTASQDANDVRKKHARLTLQRLEHALDEWETTSDKLWLERYSSALDDVRGALDWALEQDPDAAVALAGASWPLWRELSLLEEGRWRLSAAKARLRGATPLSFEARLRRGLGELWTNSGMVKSALEEFHLAAQIYRDLGELPHLGGALARLAFTLLLLGRGEEAQKVIAESLSLLERSRWRRTLATAYSSKVCIEARLGHFENAHAVGRRAVQLSEMIGANRTAFVVSGNLMELSLQMGDVDTAINVGRELVPRLRDTSHSDVLGFVLGLLASALTTRGDLDEALTIARQGIPLSRDEGMLFGQFDYLALRAGLTGRVKEAAQIIGYADSIYISSGRPREPIGELAATRLSQLLQATLSENECAFLKNQGALLTEEQAIALSLNS